MRQVFCHLKAGVEVGPQLPGAPAAAARLLATRVESRWGCLSLTEAILDAAGEALARCPAAAHVAVCSGHDVPVARVRAGALRPDCSLFTDFRCGRPPEPCHAPLECPRCSAPVLLIPTPSLHP